MSLPPAWWFVTIPETAEERDRINYKNDRFRELWETADFWAWAESMARALWGIWELDPEAGREIAEDTGRQEALEADWNDPDLILAQLDQTKETTEVINSNLQEIIEAPYIQRLIEDDVISSDIWNTILLWLQNGDYFPDVIWGIPNEDITITQKEAIINTWGLMNSEEGVEQFTQDFERDFWEQFSDRTDWVFEVELKQNAFDLVAQGYIIDDPENPNEKRQALDMAFETAVNVAINWRQFPRTEYFHVRQREVRDSNLSPDRRLQALTEILAYVNTDQWWKWTTIRETHRRARQHEMIAQAWLAEQFQSTQSRLRQAQQENNQTLIQQAQSELNEILTQASEITWTEIWDFNIALDWGSEDWEATGLS